MKTLIHSASLACALLLLSAISASAQAPDPNNSSFLSLSYSGSGCPQGTVGSSFANDRQSFTLIFDSYVASLGPNVPVTESRKNCLLMLRLNAPPGQTWTLDQTVVRGYVQLPAGVSGEQATDYSDLSTTVGADTIFRGPVARDYLTSDTVALRQDRTTCGGESLLIVNSQVRLLGGGATAAQITSDSIDGKLTPSEGEPSEEITLRLAPCGPAAPADTTAPVIVATPSVSTNANGWNNTDVVVSFTCTDTGSGVNVAGSSIDPVTLSASGTATGVCVDNAGNSASASYTAAIDKIAPTVSVTTPQTGVIYGVGAVVAASATCTDAGGSGIQSCSAPLALNTASIGLKTFTVAALDRAGNTGSSSVTYRVGGKDDCKGNGWQLFVNGFKNQGQCVSTFAGK